MSIDIPCTFLQLAFPKCVTELKKEKMAHVMVMLSRSQDDENCSVQGLGGQRPVPDFISNICFNSRSLIWYFPLTF